VEHTGDAYDVIVVGGGNAGHCAALAAAERGRRVVLLEKGPRGEHGGNSFYTAGAMRVVHGDVDDVRDLLDDDERLDDTILPAYTASEYVLDMERVTNGRNDDELTATLIAESTPTMRWLKGHGLRFRLMYERQAYRNDTGHHVFWGGLAIGSTGGGKGLVEQHEAAAREAGVEVRYGVGATGLLIDGDKVVGIRYADSNGDEGELRAESVVLAAGGFEASADMRREHLGEGWQRAKVRGTPLNTGDMLRAALEAGAAAYGDWTTCHSVAWDAGADDEGDRELTNRLTRGGYPLGIVVNADGRRFLDEGADFRNYTYAEYGAKILEQPGGVAFQLFDATTRPMLRTEEYDAPGTSVVEADSIDKLAAELGVDQDALATTVRDFNASVDDTVPFDAAVKDGRRADVDPPKSNWAQPLQRPPYYAFPVTCGITFTFGGLRADTDARVLREDGEPIPGLFVCGEMLGGLFSGNYPGGTGLVSGAVFGRRAGTLA
jgi:tricarballylate dehydrogenase